MSFWSAVAAALREPVVLRRSDLGSKFETQFVGGRLLIRLPSKVERVVDPAELRSAWRLIDSDAGPEALRFATANGPYLAAIRAHLMTSGVVLDPPGDDEGDEVMILETALVTQAASLASVIAVPIAPVAEGTDGAASVLLAEQRDQLARENARLNAAILDLEDSAQRETQRATALAEELMRTQAAQATSSVRARRSALPSYLESLETDLSGGALDDNVAVALVTALRALASSPAVALLECRKLLEYLARRAWLSVFGGDNLPARAGFSDLMYELKDQVGIDSRRWNLAKTIYGVASESMHVGAPPPTTERALMVFLALHDLRSGLGGTRS
jgi:hypothetical protein